MPPTPTSYVDQLQNELNEINTWGNLSYWDKVESIDFSMSTIGKLYLEYFHSHLEEAKKCGERNADMLKKAVPLINQFYVLEQESQIRNVDEFDDPWQRACWLRTNVAAFEAMFGGVTGELNAGYIKKYIENNKGRIEVPPPDAPKNIPKEHWWWFSTMNCDGDK